MNDKKTVLYCTHLRPSGFEALQHNSPLYSRRHQLRGHGLDVLVLGYSTTGRTERRVCEDLEVCYIDHRWDARRLVDEVRRAFPQCGSIPLVIARELPTARYALRLAGLLKCPAYYESLEVWTGYHVVNGRRLFPSYYRAFLQERLRIKRFARTLVHSRPAMDYIIRLYGLDPDRIGVLYSALPSLGEKGERPVVRVATPSDRLLLCSGGLAPNRGLEELIECFAFVPDGYKLILAGEGPLKDQLQHTVVERGLADKVLFQGVLPIDEYYQRIKHADIGIDFRSGRILNYDLAISCRVIDYINCDTPVIGSSTSGFRDVEERLGVIKCLSPGLDPQQKAEQIVSYADAFLCNPQHTEERLKHAIETEFSFEVNEQKLATWLSADGILEARADSGMRDHRDSMQRAGHGE